MMEKDEDKWEKEFKDFWKTQGCILNESHKFDAKCAYLQGCQKRQEEMGKEQEKKEEDYQKLIREILLCDPIPAKDRPDDRLEPPWEVVARIREKLEGRIKELESKENGYRKVIEEFQKVNPKLETRVKELEEGIERHMKEIEEEFGQTITPSDETLWKLIEKKLAIIFGGLWLVYFLWLLRGVLIETDNWR